MKTPVTIVGGFLGAGKTTFLTRLLSAPEGRRLAVIVNDFGDLNIDAELISEVSDDTVLLTNGCLCCSARGDLLIAARRLMVRQPQPDGVVIEASGVARPDVVARSFAASEFGEHFEVQTILALVDAEGFLELDFDAGELAIDQAAVADLVLLNKTDLAGEDTSREVARVLKEAIPHIRLIETVRAEVPLELIFAETSLDDIRERALRLPLEKAGAQDLFETFTWTSQTPLDLKAFRDALERLPRVVYRLKGFLYAADEPERRLLVQMVGRRGTIEPIGSWSDGPRTQLVVIAKKGGINQKDLAATFEVCTREERRPS